MALAFDAAVIFDSNLYTFDGATAGNTGTPSGKAGLTSPFELIPGTTSPNEP